jgi:hypothetical protein
VLGASTVLPVFALVLHLAFLENEIASSPVAVERTWLNRCIGAVGIGGSFPYVLLIGLCGWRTKGWFAGRTYLASYAAFAGVLYVSISSGNVARQVSLNGVWRAVSDNSVEMGGVVLMLLFVAAIIVPMANRRRPQDPQSPDRE